MTARHFDQPEEEPSYLNWQAQDPTLLVLNTYKNPSPTYLKLHRVGSACLRH